MNAENTLLFIADANALKLRAPVNTIAARTGEKKANVGAYLKGKSQPGFFFLINFYEAFAEDLARIGRKKVISLYIAPKSLNEAFASIHDGLKDNYKVATSIYELTKKLDRNISRVFLYDKKGEGQQSGNN